VAPLLAKLKQPYWELNGRPLAWQQYALPTLTSITLLLMPWTQHYIWHKAGYGFQSWIWFFSPLKVKMGYGCLDNTNTFVNLWIPSWQNKPYFTLE